MERRLWIVGCSRSGTTLLQRCFSLHRELYAFPETGLLLKALGMRGRTVPHAWFGLSAGKEWRAIEKLLADLGVDDPRRPRPRRLKHSLQAATAVLDRIALASGCRYWSEKTPRHYLHALAIPELIPAAHVIHIVRDGRDVVASIHDRAKRFPERFPRQLAPAYGIKAWHQAMRAHLRAANRPGHSFVFFADLLAHPETELRRLCEDTGLPFDAHMLDTPAASPGFIRPEEHWKAGATDPFRSSEDKFTTLFSPAEQAAIDKRLRTNELTRLRERLGR